MQGYCRENYSISARLCVREESANWSRPTSQLNCRCKETTPFIEEVNLTMGNARGNITLTSYFSYLNMKSCLSCPYRSTQTAPSTKDGKTNESNTQTKIDSRIHVSAVLLLTLSSFLGLSCWRASRNKYRSDTHGLTSFLRTYGWQDRSSLSEVI